MRLTPSPARHPHAIQGRNEVELSHPYYSFATKKYRTHPAHRWHQVKRIENEQAAGGQEIMGSVLSAPSISGGPCLGVVGRLKLVVFDAAIAVDMHPPDCLDREVAADCPCWELEAHATVRICDGRQFQLSFIQLALVRFEHCQTTRHGLHFMTWNLVAFQTGFMPKYACRGVLYIHGRSIYIVKSHGQIFWLVTKCLRRRKPT